MNALSPLVNRAMSAFKYTHAIVCRVPKTFKTGALGTVGEIDLNLAVKQHQNYVSNLRSIGLDVIELPPDEDHPDCVFVEDTAVVCNGTALICRPGEKSRQDEVVYMRNIFKSELNMPVQEIHDENAFLEGGDVLFTGREFFVGISKRTNEAGARALAQTFPDFPCSPVKVGEHLHLKTMITMAGPDVLCVSNDRSSQDTLRMIENLATFRYKTLTVPDLGAANVLFANGVLLHSDTFAESSKVFQEKMSHWDLKNISMTEMAKANGCLTCCSILVRKTKTMKKLA